MGGEDLLQFAWKAGIPGTAEIKSICGKSISIIQRGVLNTDSGPDFTNARIGIDGIQLAGNIEMHVRSSDWFRHKHQHDPAYKNVILHVVYEHDIPEGDERNNRLPLTVSLASLLPGSMLYCYRKLMESERFIPCSGLLTNHEPEALGLFLESLMIERLERKVNEVKRLLSFANGDWERVFFVLTSRYIQGPANAEPGERLGWMLPHLHLMRKRENGDVITAVLLGMSGLLDADSGIEQKEKLRTEYLFQKRLLGLDRELSKSDWKMSRMRPQGFPTVRLLQWAGLLQQDSWRFGALTEYGEEGFHILERCMREPAGSEEFYHEMQHGIGAEKILSIGINVFAPMLFTYGKERNREDLCEAVPEYFRKRQAEENQISRSWKKTGVRAMHAGESQALLELHSQYCRPRRCLDCRIGSQLLLNKC